MIFPVLFVVWLLGYSIISFLGKNFNLILKIGLSMLIGLGLQGVFMLLFDLVHIPVSLVNLLGASLVLTALLSFKAKSAYVSDWQNIRSSKFRLGKINFVWIFFLAITCYITYGVAIKGTYWPVTEYDSVAGYDYMAKMIATEKAVNVSIFEFSTNAIVVPRFIYPPLIAGSYSLQHMCGITSPRVVPVMFFISLLIGFYGAVRYFTTHTAAMIATAFMAVTPEMCSHAALSLTNLPNACYSSLALIVLYLYIIKNESSWLYLSAIMMALTLYSRSDSVVFSAAGMGVLLIQAIKTKNFKPLIIYSAIANSLFVAWTLYLKLVLNSNSADFFEKTLFWDGEKLDKIMTYVGNFLVWDTQLYGIGFWLFFLFFAINIKILKSDLTLFLVLSIGSWILYTFLYYQMNYIQAPLDTFMKASYKRGMFCFVPLVWFYVICNQRSVWIFQKIDQFMYR